MSRYDLKPKDPETNVAAGWDRGLNTFFFNVFKNHIPDDQPEKPTHAVGGIMNQVTYVDTFLTQLEQHAEIPPDFRETLLADQHAEPHDPTSYGAHFARILEQARAKS